MAQELDYRLSKELKDRLQTLVDGMSRGSPNDYPEYCNSWEKFRVYSMHSAR